jgi:hypothetical protein
MRPRHALARVPTLLLCAASACGEVAMPSSPEPVSGGIDTLADSSSTTTLIDEADDDTMSVRFDLAPSDLELPTDDECAASETSAMLGLRPVDIILVVDTSSSMDPVSSAVETNLHSSLTALLEDSDLDFRVIVLANYGAGASMCIAAPLGPDACAPPGPLAPVGPRLLQYSIGLGSGSFLEAILGTYSEPPSAVQAPLYAVQPTGWGPWLRADAFKVFIGITDAASMSNAPGGGDTFDAGLLALDPVQFGTVDERNFVFHTVAGMTANVPADAPWPPDAPIVTTDCVGFSGKEPGEPMQRASILSGGLRFPLCEYASIASLFATVATGVIETTPVACDLPLPAPDEGGMIDPDTLQVEYTDAGGVAHLFAQVPDPGACGPAAFWVDGDVIRLCPDACATVQQDDAATVAITYGCDVGYEPNG